MARRSIAFGDFWGGLLSILLEVLAVAVLLGVAALVALVVTWAF